MFVDSVSVEAAAGNGGNGRTSFRREKFIDRGGPDGGDGGNGGDIVFIASENQNTLAKFRFEKKLKAPDGADGSKKRQHGKSGADLPVPVPVGTAIYDDSGQLLADLIKNGQTAVIAKGGRGGFGNAHFVSSTRQAPKFAEKGEPGEQFHLKLELKMIADVGLVGLPNAGKSTLLARLSNARPEIADYPFTTLTPNLGVVDIDGSSVLFADIPGLIEGAAAGKGLGHDFLRHVERTAVILHLIDAYKDDLAAVYQTIRGELKAYDAALARRSEIVALNKTEGMSDLEIAAKMAELKKALPKKTQLFAISGQAGKGLAELLRAVKSSVKDSRQAEARRRKAKPAENEVPVIRLENDDEAWQVRKSVKGFIVSGQKIEHFAVRTDFSNDEAVARLRDIMRREGITHELVRQGISPGDTIRVGTHTLKY